MALHASVPSLHRRGSRGTSALRGAPASRLPASSHSRPAKRMLVAHGAKLPVDTDWLEDLRRVLSVEDCPIVESTAISGWHKGAYILRDRILGKKAHLHPLHPELGSELRRGTVAGWRSGFQAPCAGSSYLTFVITAALAGPLLRPMGYDEGAALRLSFELKGSPWTHDSSRCCALSRLADPP